MKQKSTNWLKVLRVILAIVVFTPILLVFIDFTHRLPVGIARLLDWQLMPAILGVEIFTIILLLLLTLLFGRIYCSVICPAGILQDIFNRISCIGKKKKNGKMRFHYHKPANWLRYSILGITAILALFGFTELCLLLDPYSNFGRISANLFRPALIWSNNEIADILSSKGNYFLYIVSIKIPIAALISAITAFVVFAVMVYFRGRWFCNTICPVGAILSIVSRYSVFRIFIDKRACNSCKSCERSCKAEAIDAANMNVDTSRCVTCFNCTSSCTKSAIKYRFAPFALTKGSNTDVYTSLKVSESEKSNVDTSKLEISKSETLINDVFDRKVSDVEDSKYNVSESRRSFIATSAALAGTVPLFALAQNNNDASGNKKIPVAPPGALSIERFKDLCTGCHLCVVQCPTQILKPAGLQYGFGYMLKPYMSFNNKYCNYSCIVCSQVCPSDAIKPISVEEKKVTQVGIAEFYLDLCVVKTDENDCGACSEHCSTQAVHMVPYKGTLTIPKIEPDLCIGCGGCESICPVRPERAIVIIPNAVHRTIEMPKEEEIKKVDVDDFGF